MMDSGRRRSVFWREGRRPMKSRYRGLLMVSVRRILERDASSRVPGRAELVCYRISEEMVRGMGGSW